MPQNLPQRNNQTNSLGEQSIREFLELQREELRLRHQENELRKIELQQNYELSREGLKQQGEFIKNAPRHGLHHKILLAVFFTIILLIVSGVLLYCVRAGKEEIALRILEIVATAIISGSGGYAWGRSKARAEENPGLEVLD
ncbi:hypothetical protein [Chitinophaga sp.]|uniref:hypothetical protein n=1 Tax=Chitinophaga sp. TaxID=1869181 RepID=UPI0031E12A9B